MSLIAAVPPAPGLPCTAYFPSADRRLASHGVFWVIIEITLRTIPVEGTALLAMPLAVAALVE